jgi:hypothetical protein
MVGIACLLSHFPLLGFAGSKGRKGTGRSPNAQNGRAPSARMRSALTRSQTTAPRCEAVTFFDLTLRQRQRLSFIPRGS